MNQFFRRVFTKAALNCIDAAADVRELVHKIGDKIRMGQVRRLWRRGAVVYAAVGGPGEPNSAAKDVTAAVNLYFSRARVLSSAALQDWLVDWCGHRHTVVELYFYRKTGCGSYSLYQAALDLDADRELHTFTDTGGDVDPAIIPAVLVGTRDAPTCDQASETTPLIL